MEMPFLKLEMMITPSCTLLKQKLMVGARMMLTEVDAVPHPISCSFPDKISSAVWCEYGQLQCRSDIVATFLAQHFTRGISTRLAWPLNA